MTTTRAKPYTFCVFVAVCIDLADEDTRQAVRDLVAQGVNLPAMKKTKRAAAASLTKGRPKEAYYQEYRRFDRQDR